MSKQFKFRWQVSVVTLERPINDDHAILIKHEDLGERWSRVLAGFADQGDAEHFAEMISDNPDYDLVEVDEVGATVEVEDTRLRESLLELVTICQSKVSPLDEVILPNGKTNHDALIEAGRRLGLWECSGRS